LRRKQNGRPEAVHMTYVSHMPEFRVLLSHALQCFPGSSTLGEVKSQNKVKGGENGDQISDAGSCGESRLKRLSR
jgi:hypothetical protein